MIKGVGIDIVEIGRIKKAVENLGDRFLNRIYTQKELTLLKKRKKTKYPELAARFAAKEAYSKAIGTGMRGIHWKKIEILSDPRGKPEIHVNKNFYPQAHVSLTHDGNLAMAFVVLEE